MRIRRDSLCVCGGIFCFFVLYLGAVLFKTIYAHQIEAVVGSRIFEYLPSMESEPPISKEGRLKREKEEREAREQKP